MSLLNVEMYDALLATGTPEPQARDAAKVMADADMRVITMAERLNGLDIESNGGTLVQDGSRRRSPGGTFLHLVRQRATAEERAVIFRRAGRRA